MSALTPAEKKVIDEAVYAAEQREPDETLFEAVAVIVKAREIAAVTAMAEKWQWGGWADNLRKGDDASPIAVANRVVAWMRNYITLLNGPVCPVCAGSADRGTVADLCEPHRNDFIGWADTKNRERAERAQARFDATPFEKPVSGNTGNADAKTEENR